MTRSRTIDRRATNRPEGRIVARFLVAVLFAVVLPLATSACQAVQVVADQMSLTPIVPPRGIFYSHFKAPLVLPSGDEEAPVGTPPAAPRRLVYLKIPYANVDFSTGRAGLEGAARKAGLARVVYADYEYRSVLGYFQTITIHAWGVPPEAP